MYSMSFISSLLWSNENIYAKAKAIIVTVKLEKIWKMCWFDVIITIGFGYLCIMHP